MVLGIVMMTALLPTIIGMNEATKETRDHEEKRRKNARTQRSHLVATCDYAAGSREQRQAVHNAQIYLGRDGRVYISKAESASSLAPFTGSFYQHPDFPPENTAGLVTISGETPPTLRWVYVDVITHEVRWGGRRESEGQICGPFDWTDDEAQITLEGWEGWMAVRLPDDEIRIPKELGLDDSHGLWRLYFDQNDDGADLPPDAEVVEICLHRTSAEV